MGQGISFSFKKEILTHDTKWMNLEDMMLSEISQPGLWYPEQSNS